MSKRFPLYSQLDSTDCGPTCLKMITSFYGKTFHVSTLLKNANSGKNGASLLGLSEAAEQIGFRTVCTECTAQQLVSNAVLPAILFWDNCHFVVLYNIKRGKNKNKYFISDPIGEQYILCEDDFLAHWSNAIKDGIKYGAALLLEPRPEFYMAKGDIDESPLKRYIHHLVPHKKSIKQLTIGIIALCVLSFFTPFLAQAVVDKGINYQDLNFITLVLVAQLILLLSSTIIEFFNTWISLHVNTQLNIAIISDFLAKLMNLPYKYFESKNLGDILQRVKDHDRIEEFLTTTPLSSLYSVINFMIFSIILAYYEFTILCIFLIGNIVNLVWISVFFKVRKNIDRAKFRKSAEEQSLLCSIIEGMSDIKLYNSENSQKNKWRSLQLSLYRINAKSISYEQIQSLGSLILTQSTSIIVTFLSAKAVVNGELTLGVMVAISFILGQLAIPLSKCTQVLHSIQDAKISMERLNEIHSQPSESQDEKFDSILPSIAPSIKISGVSFSYTENLNDLTLRNIDLDIPANKITAIVGESGSGKTTLMKLLIGFYKPTVGNIFIEEENLNNICPKVWRTFLGCVLQDSYIFSDSILNNIVPTGETPDLDKVMEVTKIANIYDFIISLPEKFNTRIGLNGIGLSQGQKQRLHIARALYKSPKILILDEATNALDTINEKDISNKLNTVFNNKTVIIVAHRLSTIKNADNIVVIDKGVVVEQGSHLDLINKRGKYFNLIENQLSMTQCI